MIKNQKYHPETFFLQLEAFFVDSRFNLKRLKILFLSRMIKITKYFPLSLYHICFWHVHVFL